MGSKVRRRGVWLLVMLMSLLGGGHAWAEGNECGQPAKQSHYVAQAGDTADATHLSASRAFAGVGRLEVNMCGGELQIRRSKDGRLHLSVETQKAPDAKMQAYVKDLQVTPGDALINLQFAKQLHPVVVLALPAEAQMHSTINLGAGHFQLHADDLKGDWEINVGAGNATLYLAGDRDYSRLQANVGMGSFHDNRPGGGSAHFVISRNLAGKGTAPIKVNVGAGSIDLDPAED